MADDEKTQLELKMTSYQKVLRKKIGEFMLIINDLITRNVKVFLNAYDFKDKQSIINTITSGENKSTDNWTGDKEIRTLMKLLYNNGYPFQLHNYLAQEVKEGKKPPGTYKYPEDNFFDGDVLYKSYVILGDLKGDAAIKPNHYTMELPNELMGVANFPNGLTQIGNGVTSVKIKVPGDGHCFYKAFSIWCMTYGVTEDHLKNLSYNVPFEFDKATHMQNFKVDKTGYIKGKPFPKPLSPPTEFQNTAVEIAKKMINKIKPGAEDGAEDGAAVSPMFDEEKDITESEEYKAYLEKIKDDDSHCNKYKGNKNPAQ